MPKLNFYDTDAVKAFLLNTLVENKEVREDVDFERRQSQTWFTQYQAQKGRAEAAEAVAAREEAQAQTNEMSSNLKDAFSVQISRDSESAQN